MPTYDYHCRECDRACEIHVSLSALIVTGNRLAVGSLRWVSGAFVTNLAGKRILSHHLIAGRILL